MLFTYTKSLVRKKKKKKSDSYLSREIAFSRRKEATFRGERRPGNTGLVGPRLVNVGQLTRDDVIGFSDLCRARVVGRGKEEEEGWGGRDEWKRETKRGVGRGLCSPARR